MPWPAEYQRATDKFYEFLMDVKELAGLGSTHMVYTTVQGVFQCFRRRIEIKDAIHFANALPVGLRALFIADWNTDEVKRPFADIDSMTKEVQDLRREHNFSPNNSISLVARALSKHVEPEKFQLALSRMSEEARNFWHTDLANRR
jgi:uncharacterized protein (DUF2267 family)